MSKSQKVYFPGLYGLRFYAAFSVIICHVELFKAKWGIGSFYSHKLIQGLGGIGVDFFFVLSGFLITFLLLKEKETSGSIDIKKFYFRRILRIWPLYYLIILLCFFILPYVEYPEVPGLNIQNSFYERLILFALFLPNFSKAIFEFVPYGGMSWSVGVEEQFYLLWPVLFFMGKNVFKNILFFIFLLLLVKISVLYFSDFYSQFFDLQVLRKVLASLRFELMGLGGLSAILLFQNPKKIKYLFSLPIQLLSFLAVPAIVLFIPTYIDDAMHIMLGIPFAIIILNISSNSKSIIKLENKIYTFLGKVSYGIYMFHMIVIGGLLGLFEYFDFDLNFIWFNVVFYVLTIIITITLSYISYKFLEKPFLKIKAKNAVIESGI